MGNSGAEGFRNDSGNLSYWRIANGLFQPRSLYLGEDDALIGRVNKIRGFVGLALVVFFAVRYQHLLAVTHTVSNGQSAYDAVGIDSFWASYPGSIAKATLISVGTAFTVGILIVTLTHAGRRVSAARQLCWPLATLGMFIGFMALVFLAVHAMADIMQSKGKFNLLELIGLVIFWLLVTVPTVKAIYLVTTGLFRADDGHPLLAPIAVPLAAWILAFYNWFYGPSLDFPGQWDFLATFGGAGSLTLLTFLAIFRLRQRYPSDFPFLNGPLRT